MKGRIHSFESCGTVDGPGIRFIVFFQGCPLRCIYCHNPDTWLLDDGKLIESSEIVKEIRKYKSFMKFSNGGVTISGGEPFIQFEFLLELCKQIKNENIHIAVDSSGYTEKEKLEIIIDYVDLFLIDLKSYNENTYKEITGKDFKKTIETINYLDDMNKKIWIRYVLLPGYTDVFSDIDKMGKYLSGLKNIDKVEILPFHKMGEEKWRALNYDYELYEAIPPSKEIVNTVKEILEKYNLKVV